MIIYNAKIFLEDTIIDKGFVRTKNGKITDIQNVDIPPELLSGPEKTVDAKGNIIAPGYVNQHVHAALGVDFIDAVDADYETIAEDMLKEGVTSYLATTMTMPIDSIDRVCELASRFTSTRRQAELLGLHLEGPFVNPEYKGAQNEANIIMPDNNLIRRWMDLSDNRIRMVSYAIEGDTDFMLLSYLKAAGITPSCAHSGANYRQVIQAQRKGLSSITHFFNGMSKWESRRTGVVTAGLSTDIAVELIADGYHVHPDGIKALYDIKGPDKIILITDANRAKGMPDGKFYIGDLEFNKENSVCMLPNGSLAGSVLRMEDAVKNMVRFTGCSLHEAVNMASRNPAVNIGVFKDKGSIKIGKDADLLMMDKSGNILGTFVCKTPSILSQ